MKLKYECLKRALSGMCSHVTFCMQDNEEFVSAAPGGKNKFLGEGASHLFIFNLTGRNDESEIKLQAALSLLFI